MYAIQYNTNKYGEFIPYNLKPGCEMSNIVTAKKSTVINRIFLGFGVAITGSSCYNLSLMNKDERNSFLRGIYSKEGLNLSVGRLSIGSSDYSAELYTYDDNPNDTQLKYFSIERDLEYIVPIIKEILEINPNLTIFASPWSPPAWMKTGGEISGGYMREKYIECYADYIVKYIKAYAEQGIIIKAITPQNEPETQQNGNMPACIWHPETEAKFIITLNSKFKENNIDTEIWCHDHNFSSINRIDWYMKEYELYNFCNGIAFHYYAGTVEETVVLKEKYPSLNLHFTEGGPRLYDNYDTDWCKWAIMMIKVLNCGYSSFTGWNLMLDETGGPNVGPFFCGGLVTRNRINGNLNYSGQYKAVRHLAPFIKKDSEIYQIKTNKNHQQMSCYPSQTEPVIGCVIKNGEENEVLVLVNPSEVKAQVQYRYKNNWWYIELLPQTASTVVFCE